MVGVGTVTITATQASDANYNGGSIALTLTVSKLNPTISGFANINKTFGDANFTLTAPTSNSSGAFVYTSSNSSVASISGSTITIVGAGTATITATQASNASYNGGTIAASITVSKANTILSGFNSINKVLGAPSFSLSNPTSNRSGSFVYTSSNPAIASINGNVVTINSVGNVVLTATQIATNNYNSDSITTTLNITSPSLVNLNRYVNDTSVITVDTDLYGNLSANDTAMNVIYGSPIANNSNPSVATISINSNGQFNFRTRIKGSYSYTIPICSNNQNSGCPTTTLFIEATYLPQGSIGLKYNTLLKTDSVILKLDFTEGQAPFKVQLSNTLNGKKDTISNLGMSNFITLKPIDSSAIYKIDKIWDNNSVLRVGNFSKDTASLIIAEPNITLKMSADPAKKLNDSLYSNRISLNIENKGIINVNGVQVNADLTNVFPEGMTYYLDSVVIKSGDIQLNPIYDGVSGGSNSSSNAKSSFSLKTSSQTTTLAGTDLFNIGVRLKVRDKGDVDFFFRIIPKSITAPLKLQFTGNGNGELIQNDGKVSTTPASAVSNDAKNDNGAKPAALFVPIIPINYIGTALNVKKIDTVASALIVTYQGRVTNYSNSNLDSIKLSFDLNKIYQTPDSATLIGVPLINGNAILNPSFNGRSDAYIIRDNAFLKVGDSISVEFKVKVKTTNGTKTWENYLTTSGVTGLGNIQVTDTSTFGLDPDPNGDGLPFENLKTKVSIGYTPPSNPVISNKVIDLNSANKPTNISFTLVSTPRGTIPLWCKTNETSCTFEIPNLPSKAGLYQWRVKALDTLSGLTSSGVIDTLIIRPFVEVTSLKYVNTVRSNPVNIVKSIKSIAEGSIPLWCDKNGANCSVTVPLLPTVKGNYIWYVKAKDTASQILSSDFVIDTVTILDPIDVADLTSEASAASLQPNGSFIVTYKLAFKNKTASSMSVSDMKLDLVKLFKTPSEFEVISVSSTGNFPTIGYDGKVNTNLLNSSALVREYGSDTIKIAILFKSDLLNGNYQISSSANLTTEYGTFNQITNDYNLNQSDPSRRVPSSITIPKLNVIIPEGFSPNNDGIDDAWIITRPYGTQIGITIYNRWGSEVYKNEDYKNDWKGEGKGSLLGNLLPEGTYFYNVFIKEANGNTSKLIGSLTLIR